MTKQQAILQLKHIIADFNMAASGEWVPDKHSAQASIDSVEEVIKFIEEQKSP